jgi:hypothetical protein
MKQVKIFKLPEEVGLANNFLAITPPEAVATLSKGDQCYIVVNYDDQSYPVGYVTEELKGLITSNIKEAMTNEISRDVMGVDLVVYEDKLKQAQAELELMEKEKAPDSKKEKYDWEKAQGEKILKQKELVTEKENSVNNIKNGINGLTESIVRVNSKIAILKKKLEEVTKV